MGGISDANPDGPAMEYGRCADMKTYDRFVGVCHLDGKDIGLAVIKAGLALDCPRFRVTGEEAPYLCANE